MLTIDQTTRLSYRKEAHHLKPLVLIGDAGLTEAVLAELARHLDVHGLVKIRAREEDREQREAWWQQILQVTQAVEVARIGKQLVVYRTPLDEAERRAAGNHNISARSHKKGLPPKSVFLVKASRNSKRPPMRKEIVIKGNERLTAGGLVKTRKVRQQSSKKRAMGGQ